MVHESMRITDLYFYVTCFDNPRPTDVAHTTNCGPSLQPITPTSTPVHSPDGSSAQTDIEEQSCPFLLHGRPAPPTSSSGVKSCSRHDFELSLGNPAAPSPSTV